MIWVYEKGINSTIIYGSYSKRTALKHFKGKKGIILLDFKTGKDLNR